MWEKIQVLKSNGNLEKFDIVKLRNSILKAYEAANLSPVNLRRGIGNY